MHGDILINISNTPHKWREEQSAIGARPSLIGCPLCLRTLPNL